MTLPAITPAATLQNLLVQVQQQLHALLGQTQALTPSTTTTGSGPMQLPVQGQLPTQGLVFQSPLQFTPHQTPTQSPLQGAPMKAPMKTPVTAGGPTYHPPVLVKPEPRPVVVVEERPVIEKKKRKRDGAYGGGGGGMQQAERQRPKSYIRAHNNGNGEMGSRERHESPKNLRTTNGDPGNNSSSTKRAKNSKVGNGRSGGAR